MDNIEFEMKHLILRSLTVFLVLTGFLSAACSSAIETGIDLRTEGLRLQLINKDFGQIYDEASDELRNRMTREEFIVDTRTMVDKVERIDKDFRWEADDFIPGGHSIRNFEKSSSLAAYKRVKSGDQVISLLIYWELRGREVKLYAINYIVHSPSTQSGSGKTN